MLTLRDYTPARQTAQRLPRFPEKLEGRAARRNTNGLLSSRAEAHARRAWDDARLYAVNRSMNASVVTDGNPGGLLELVMVSALADHVARCPHCWETSTWSGDRPGDWISWATLNSRLAPYLRFAAAETAGRQRKSARSSSMRVEPKAQRKRGERWVKLALAARERRESVR